MVVNGRYINNSGAVGSGHAAPSVQKPASASGNFEKILQEKLQRNSDVKFSKHAEMRLQMRNIHLTEAQKQKIGLALEKAEGKGVKDTLVLMDNLAFVANVKNRTVITAVSSSELKDNVFTNIDGAVFG